jgi:hypothetical protein
MPYGFFGNDILHTKTKHFTVFETPSDFLLEYAYPKNKETTNGYKYTSVWGEKHSDNRRQQHNTSKTQKTTMRGHKLVFCPMVGK